MIVHCQPLHVPALFLRNFTAVSAPRAVTRQLSLSPPKNRPMNIVTVVHFGLSCLSACWHVNWRFDIFDIVVIDFVTDSCFQWLTYGAQLPYRTVS